MPLFSIILGLIGAATLYGDTLPLPYPTAPWTKGHPMWRTSKPELAQIPAYVELKAHSPSYKQTLPELNDSSGTLGYTHGATFRTPKELRAKVDFWKEIYTVYTTHQAVLHDNKHLKLRYGVVELGDIETNTRLTRRQKDKRISKRLKKAKKEVENTLKELHRLQNTPLQIPLSAFRWFPQFETHTEENRFSEAATRIRAQIGQRDRIVTGIFTSGRYLNRILKVFESKQLPKELVLLPLVESAYNLKARSKVGASGVWQFMPATAKQFMYVNHAVDERNDPLIASEAAAALLRKNYEALKSWPLAITAYNHGRMGMSRAVASLGTKHLPTIIERYESETFGFASSNFYAEFLAVLELVFEYQRHIGRIGTEAPMEFDRFTVHDSITLSDLSVACGVPQKQLADLNPALTRWVVSGKGYIPRHYPLRVPTSTLDRCTSGYQNVSKVSQWKQD